MRDERAAMDQVGRAWDAVVRSGEAASPDLDPDLMTVIRRVHDLGAVPTAAARERVWHRLQDSRDAVPVAARSAPRAGSASGIRRSPRRLPPTDEPPREPISHWALAQLSTAALVLLTLLGGLFAAAGRFDRPHAMPAVIPAASDAAAPEAREPAGFAEFLWSARGGPNLTFNLPGHPAIDPAGNIWVPDSGHDRFQIFSPDGAFLESWGAAGGGDGQFTFANQLYPMAAVAFAPAGAFYVVDSGNDRIQKFGPDRSFLLTWGGEGSGPGQFKAPDGIAVDREGRVYVTDDQRQDVQVFDDQGHFLRKIGGYGFGEGQFLFSGGSNVFVDAAGRIWVSDSTNHRIQTFSPDGSVLSILDKGPDGRQLGAPGQVAIDADGRIFVTVPDQQQIQVFASDGTFLAALGSADTGDWGTFGLEPGKFLWPDGLVLDGRGNVYITDAEMERLQKFRLLPPFAPD